MSRLRLTRRGEVALAILALFVFLLLMGIVGSMDLSVKDLG